MNPLKMYIYVYPICLNLPLDFEVNVYKHFNVTGFYYIFRVNENKYFFAQFINYKLIEAFKGSSIIFCSFFNLTSKHS